MNLKRAISRWDLVLLIFNCIVGAGIFGLPSKTFSVIGLYSIPAFLLCAVIMMVFILNFSEVGSRFKKTGGPYLYIKEAYGPFAGFMTGWVLIISRMAGFAALVNLMVDYLGYFHEFFINPITRALSLTGITLILFGVNLKSVKSSTRLNNALGILKFLPLLVFIGVGLFFLEPELLKLPAEAPSLPQVNQVLLILVFAFTGFEASVINSGEMKNPKKDIPFALITATLFVTVFYMLIQLVAIGTYPQLSASVRPLTDVADHLFGGFGGIFITIGAILSIGGTLNANLLGASRLPYALSEQKQFPQWLQKVNPESGIPYLSLCLYTAVTLLVSLSGTFIYALAINVISKLFIFGGISLALITFRKRSSSPKAHFTIRYGMLSGIAGVVLSIWLLAFSDLSNFLHVFITALAGGFLFLFSHKKWKARKLLKATDH